MKRDTFAATQNHPPPDAAPKSSVDLNSNSTDNRLSTSQFTTHADNTLKWINKWKVSLRWLLTKGKRLYVTWLQKRAFPKISRGLPCPMESPTNDILPHFSPSHLQILLKLFPDGFWIISRQIYVAVSSLNLQGHSLRNKSVADNFRIVALIVIISWEIIR